MPLPTRWIKVLKDILGNKVRTVLVILSITIGVFAVGMTTNARLIIQRDLNEPFRATNPASTTLYVTPFDEALVHAVEDMREVGQAEARRLEVVKAYRGGDEWADLELTVVQDYSNVRINQFTLEAGQSVPGLRQIVLERQTAAMLNVSVGDMVTVELPDEERSYNLEVAGVVHDMHKIPPQWIEQGAGYVSMETLRWMGAGAYYNSLDIIVAENPTDKDHILHVAGLVRDRVIEPSGYSVVGVWSFRGEPGEHYFSGDVSGVLIILMVMGVMCILLGAGLVINTVSALIARQVQQIGIIRSVGGLRKQITSMYLSSILAFSVCALLIAIPLGLLGAGAMAVGISEQLNFDVTRVNLPFSVALLQVAVGLLVPIGAAIVPIMSGTRISVYDAIYQHGNITAVNKGVIEELLKKIKGLSSPIILAVRNTFRRKARLAFTLATLTLAGATFMAAFSTHRTMKEKIVGIGRYWLFDVALNVSGSASRYTVEREALRVEDVVIAEGWYQTSARVIFPDGSESEGIEVMAVPYDSATLDPLLLTGRWLQEGDTDAIVVNDDTRDEVPGLKVGSQVVLRVDGPGRQVDRRYEVVGIVSRHLYGARIYAPYEFFTKVNGAQGQANLVRVRTDPVALKDGVYQAALATRLEQHFEDAGLGSGSSETQYDAVVTNTGNFDILLSVLLLMSALLALVGGLGLAGTMSLNVLERTREIGVLRAVGASNASVRKVVLFEGVFVGLISWVLGAIVGVPFGYVLSGFVSAATLRAKAEFLFSAPGMWLWLALVLVIAAVASLAPAQRASRLTVREVLAYE